MANEAPSPPPSHPAPEEVAALLRHWAGRDRAALDRLLPLVLDEVRQLARRAFGRERAGHTLQPTALISELYLKLAGSTPGALETREQFLAFVSTLIREILVDHARLRNAAKRGHGAPRQGLDEVEPVLASPAGPDPETLLAVHQALERLAQLDRRQAQVVELRYVVGLTQEEVARLLDLSLATVERDWATARRWLARELGRR